MTIRNAGAQLISNRFHALTHRNYRYFWYGQCVSLIGTWMQNISLSWLVLTLTGSPMLLGFLGAAQFLPITLFALFAGTIVDKFPKKNILLFTQTLSMIFAFILSFLVFTNLIQYPIVILVAFCLGVINTFDMPTRQSFFIEIVGKEDLVNAIGLNSLTFNLARILGPSIGALMMAFFGAGWCFLLNGLSFLAVIYSLLRIQTVPYVRQKKEGVSMFSEIKDGIVYMFSDRFLAQTIVLLALAGTLAYNWNVLIPVFTKTILHLDEKSYGLLMSCLGFGSLIGAVTQSLRSKQGPKLSITIVGSLVIAVFLFLNGLSHSMAVSCFILIISGFFNILFATNCNSSLQLHSKDEYRTRVMSVYTLLFAGSTPIGNLFVGFIADHRGADGAFIWSGLVLLAFSLITTAAFWMKRDSLGQHIPS